MAASEAAEMVRKEISGDAPRDMKPMFPLGQHPTLGPEATVIKRALDSGHNITVEHQIVFLAQNPSYSQIPPSSPLFTLLMHLELLL